MKFLIKPAADVASAVTDTAALLQQSGPLERGQGLASGVTALSLAILCFLGVLAFHFPQYLTTPELRQKYNPDVIRSIMFAAMVVHAPVAIPVPFPEKRMCRLTANSRQHWRTKKKEPNWLLCC